MLNIDFYISVITYALVMTVTPGPNNLMILASGLNYGVGRSVPHLCGIAFGFLIMVVLVGVGLGALFKNYPVIHSVLKIVGCIYLLFLAWKLGTTSTTEKEGNYKRKPLTFLQAALFQWVNPKAWICSITAVSVFTFGENISYQVLIMSIIFFISIYLTSGLWLIGGSLMQKLLKKPLHQRVFNIVMGVLLALLTIPILFSS